MGTLAAQSADHQAPYHALARVYDRWMALDRIPYAQWDEFTTKRFAEASGEVRTVVDICCGTGMTTRSLQDHGYQVTGVDAAPEMLEIARERTDPGTVLVPMTMPDERFVELGPFDAALVCFDGANYFTGKGALEDSLCQIARVLRPGGVLVFDLSTRRNFEVIAGMGQFGEDFGDFAYLWDTRHVDGSPLYEYLVTLFVQAGQLYRRVVERHEQRWFSRDHVERALTVAGFEGIAVRDDYSEQAAGDRTRRDTWSARSA